MRRRLAQLNRNDHSATMNQPSELSPKEAPGLVRRCRRQKAVFAAPSRLSDG
jgi:hypothetical protein